MSSILQNTPVAKVLDALYEDAEQRRAQVADQPDAFNPTGTALERFTALKDQYMPIDRPFGNLLYALIRSARPATVVEFGMSFGISTIYLAAALKDNGKGRVVTTEFIAEKADNARQNFDKAGLADWIEVRVGDATQTLQQPLPGPVDLLMLDGDKAMYIDILKLLEPSMQPGSLVASDNTDQPGAATYLEHVRDPANGYITSALLTTGGSKHQSGHELSVKL
ncbi:MAG: class I SAM-dependent methyltransferase [Planctomycetota bacterium]